MVRARKPKKSSLRALTIKEAQEFSSNINIIKQNLNDLLINQIDFICIYILLYIKLLFPNNWLLNPLQNPLQMEDHWMIFKDKKHKEVKHYEFKYIIELLNYPARLNFQIEVV